MSVIHVWTWQQAIGKAKLDSSTKLVLFTLSNYMNPQGSGCYPSIDTIVAESSLARATVIKHIGLAVKAGFIKKRQHGLAGRKWKRNEYCASFPSNYELLKSAESDDNWNDGSSATEPAQEEKGSSLTEPPHKKGSSVSEPPHERGGSLTDGGGSIDVNEVVHSLNSTYPVTYPKNYPVAQASAHEAEVDFSKDFKKFLQAYPKNEGWPAMETEYYKLRQAGVDGDVLQGASECYASNVIGRETPQRFIKKGHKFLSDGTWQEYVSLPKSTCDDEPNDTAFRAVKGIFLKTRRLEEWASWLGRLTLISRRENTVCLLAPSRFIGQHVQTHYQHFLTKAWQEVEPGIQCIEIQLGETTQHDERCDGEIYHSAASGSGDHRKASAG